jgi:hypothetical protein
MRISIEDSRTGKVLRIDVKDNQRIQRIIDVIIKTLGILDIEGRSFTLVLNDQELPTTITIDHAVHKYGLKENDKLTLWTKVLGGMKNL